MSQIDIYPQIENWLEQAVFSMFSQRGIAVTQAAKNVIAYTVQAQQEEETPPHLQQEFDTIRKRILGGASAAGTFFENAAAIYLEVYPARDLLNVNRAVRLMAEIYFRRFGGFPCGPTKGGKSGAGSGGKGKAGVPSVPAGAGA